MDKPKSIEVVEGLIKSSEDMLKYLAEWSEDRYSPVSRISLNFLSKHEDKQDVKDFINCVEMEDFFVSDLVGTPKIQRLINDYNESKFNLQDNEFKEVISFYQDKGVNLAEAISNWFKEKTFNSKVSRYFVIEGNESVLAEKFLQLAKSKKITPEKFRSFYISDAEILEVFKLLYDKNVNIPLYLQRWHDSDKITKASLKSLYKWKGNSIINKFLCYAEADPFFILDFERIKGYEYWVKIIDKNHNMSKVEITSAIEDFERVGVDILSLMSKCKQKYNIPKKDVNYLSDLATSKLSNKLLFNMWFDRNYYQKIFSIKALTEKLSSQVVDIPSIEKNKEAITTKNVIDYHALNIERELAKKKNEENSKKNLERIKEEKLKKYKRDREEKIKKDKVIAQQKAYEKEELAKKESLINKEKIKKKQLEDNKLKELARIKELEVMSYAELKDKREELLSKRNKFQELIRQEEEFNFRDYSKIKNIKTQDDNLLRKEKELHPYIEVHEEKIKQEKETKRKEVRKEKADNRASINLFLIGMVALAYLLLTLLTEFFQVIFINIFTLIVSILICIRLYINYRNPHGTPCSNCGDYETITEVDRRFSHAVSETKQKFVWSISNQRMEFRDIQVASQVYDVTFKCNACENLTYATDTFERNVY